MNPDLWMTPTEQASLLYRDNTLGPLFLIALFAFAAWLYSRRAP